MLTQEIEKAEMLSPSPGTTRPPRALPDALSQCMCGTHTHTGIRTHASFPAFLHTVTPSSHLPLASP